MKERDRLTALTVASATTAAPAVSKDGLDELERFKSRLGRRLLQAGMKLRPSGYLGIVAALSGMAALLASTLGMLLALASGIVVGYYLLTQFLEERALKRNSKIVPHIPPFIDGITASLATGFNIEGAIVEATNGVPPGPLRSELDRVVLSLSRGFTLQESIGILRQSISAKEMISLCVALSLFASIGGKILEPFRRLARKIRDQQQVTEKARRDLVIVKQAFFIIFLLAVTAPLALLIIAPDYMQIALRDRIGRLVLQAGILLVLVALLLFKRLTFMRI